MKLLPFMAMLFAFSMEAQVNLALTGDFSPCGTTENMEWLRQTYPDEFLTEDEFEAKIAAKIEEMRHQKLQINEMTIPVVVHVIHDGDNLNEGQNISVAQILSQIQVVNEDFGKTLGSRGENNDPRSADIELEWCLAQVDPDGNPTDGITRHDFGVADWDIATFNAMVKPNTIWDPQQYCNIWVARMQGTLAGYAQLPVLASLPGLPSSTTASHDGIVMDHRFFGTVEANNDGSGTYLTINGLGKVLTHEIGHWLGLRHIWGGSTCGDDYCADTPQQEGPHTLCPVAPVTCDGAEDMVANYMDYTSDNCRNVFTNDQKARMMAVLAMSDRRMQLPTSNKCTSSPKVQFSERLTVGREKTATGPNCSSFVDYPIELRISEEPSEDVVVSFSTSGTATEGQDYELRNNSVTFLANDAKTQSLTLRIFDDSFIEGVEFIYIDIDVATTGDAEKSSYKFQHTIRLTDDDLLPEEDRIYLYLNDFSTPLSTSNYDATGGGLWERSLNPPQEWSIFGNRRVPNFETADNGFLLFDSGGKGDDGIAEEATYVIGQFNFTGIDNAFIEFDVEFCKRGQDSLVMVVQNSDGAIGYSFFGGNIPPFSCTGNPTTVIRDISSKATNNPSVLIAFRYYGDNDFWCMIDDFKFFTKRSNPIQASVNVANPESQQLGPNQTAFFRDPATGNIMMSIQNNSNFDYGCVDVLVNRQGNGAEEAWATPTSEYIASKTFSVTPEFNNPTGDFNISLYYRDAEVDGWTAATGKTAADLLVIKTNGDITNPQNGDARERSLVGQTSYVSGYVFTGNFSTGFSDFGIGPENATVFPVELTYFIGDKRDNGNYLAWETAYADKASHFELEYSNNGISFEKIAQVATINSTNTENYNHLHKEPSLGNNYYRLRMVDLDGTFEFSEIIILKRSSRDPDVSIYPNPVNSEATISLNSNYREDVEVNIIDAAGQKMRQEKITLDLGLIHTPINLDDLSSGIYFIQIISGKQKFPAYRFLKT